MYNEKQYQIINTAEKLFAQKGFDGTSVRDIAEEAGVNIAMISYYFGSKDKLMQALFEERTHHVQLQVENLLKDENSQPFEKVGKLVDDYIDRLMHRQRFFRIMICEQVMEKNSFVTSLLHNMKQKNLESIQLLIQDGQQKGAFRKEIDVVLMINTLIGTVSQTMINEQFYRKFYNLQDLNEQEFQQAIKQKLSAHIKTVYKAIITNES